MKPLKWFGDSRKSVKGFPVQARHRAGIELLAVQLGTPPADWKPMPSIGIGVNEIRVHSEKEYRVIYVAKFAEAIYVLHAFGKKTRQTSKHDVDLAKQRYRELLNERRTL